MRHSRRIPPAAGVLTALIGVAAGGPVAVAADEDAHPLSPKDRQRIAAEARESVEKASRALQSKPKSTALYGARGDAWFFLGEFDKAVADYDRMVELDPRLEKSHWRRGIAWFYAGEFEKAAHQFEIYHTFDDVDRENGIWRYFSQLKAYGPKKARQGLLKYAKDDREPFPDVYKLFAGKIMPEKILQRIENAKIDDRDRAARRFYAHLYIGLNHAVEKRPEKAREHLHEAVANEWAPQAGFGPRYMWHVGRLHYERLREADSVKESVR